MGPCLGDLGVELQRRNSGKWLPGFSNRMEWKCESLDFSTFYTHTTHPSTHTQGRQEHIHDDAFSSPEYARISHFPLLPSFLPSSSVLSFVPHTPQIPGKGFPDFQIAAQDEERATSSSPLLSEKMKKTPIFAAPPPHPKSSSS